MSSVKATVIVTGAAGGIGTGFVTEFLKSVHAAKYHCIYVVHPTAQGSLKHLLEHNTAPNHSYEIVSLDLSVLAEVQAFAASIVAREEIRSLGPIRGLLLIAGGVFISRTSDDGLDFTRDGLEMTFVVNYLANFLLVLHLLQCVAANARIVFISSTTHNPAYLSNRYAAFRKDEYRLLFRDVEHMAKAKEKIVKGDNFDAAMRRYGTSKLLMNMFMYELQRRLDSDSTRSNVSILAMDPGAVGGTNLYYNFPFFMHIILAYLIVPLQLLWVYIFPNGRLRSATKVGKDLIFACFDEEILGKHPGSLYLNGTDVTDSSPESHDEGKQRDLWAESLKLVQSISSETWMTKWK